MAEALIITSQDKQQKYQELLPQIEALLKSERDQIANLANIAAALKEVFQWLWVGFYLVKNDMLLLGPFQGPIACTRIALGRGVCGMSWQKCETIIVPDVNQFPGHIACSSRAQSEIVLPLLDASGNCIGVLDADSENLNDFDQTDAIYLNKILNLLLNTET